jgi:HEAT repeat protein
LDFAPPEARAINIEAICAFITLRDQAKPALPQLQTLMESTNSDIALHAMLASCGTGSNAIPLLLNGLTNQFADVRNEAANYVTQNFSNQFLGRRDQVIPLFVKLLNDSYNDVRMNATNELKQIDAAAALKAGVK